VLIVAFLESQSHTDTLKTTRTCWLVWPATYLDENFAPINVVLRNRCILLQFVAKLIFVVYTFFRFRIIEVVVHKWGSGYERKNEK
jgi:hypothetical protein